MKQIPERGASVRERDDRIRELINGQNNAVLDFTVPASWDGATPYTVNALFATPDKWIHLMPLNQAAVNVAPSLLIGNLQRGSFDIGLRTVANQWALVQVSQRNGSVEPLSGTLPFDTVDSNINWTVNLVANTIESLVNGAVQIAFTVSGEYATGRNYTFGVRTVSGPSHPQTFSVRTSTSNQNDVVSVSGTLIAQPVAIGDVFEIYGTASGAATTFTYDLTASLMPVTPNRGYPTELLSDVGDMQFRAIILG